LERRILAARKFKHTALATQMSLGYLKSRSRVYNALFRQVVLVWGMFFQRLGTRVVAFIPDIADWKALWPVNMLRNPMPSPGKGTLHSILPKLEAHQALIVNPPGEFKKTVFYFPGCGSERLYSDVGKASLFLMLKTGIRVVMPPPFLCCGFPINVNAQVTDNNRRVLGDTIIFSQIREMMRHMAFDACVVSCGTCKEALHDMGTSEIFSAPIEDVSQFAVSSGLKMEQGGDYLYHRPCHDSMNETALPFFKTNAGIKLTHVPHCCSEAGTLALSRPDIAFNMLDKKAGAIKKALEGRSNDGIMLTNCPSCLQGLGRNAVLGVKPRHMAVELARRAGGEKWEKELKEFLKTAEVVNF
jgi:Fe-S oxidoreductase